MSKSNGIKSLKQAAKLLNKHSPDGESLAYINKDEAKLLRSHGGSGIQTLAGVPSYIDWGNLLDLGKKYIPSALDFGKKVYDIYKGSGVGNANATINTPPYFPNQGDVMPPLYQVGEPYDDYNAGRFDNNQVGTYPSSKGPMGDEMWDKSKNPFWQDIGGSILKSGKDFLTGRYGGGEGIKNIAKDAFSVWTALKAKKDQEGLNNAEMEQFNKLNQQMLEHTEEFQANIAGGGVENVPTDITDVASYTDVTLPDMITTPTAAQGGRIGAFNGGIQGLMPQQGFMPQPGLDPRMGYAAQGGRIGYQEGTHPLDEVAMQMFGMTFENLNPLQQITVSQSQHQAGGYSFPPEVLQIMEEGQEDVDINKRKFDEVLRKIGAQGGRIGAQSGGIMPLLDMGGMEKDYRQDGGFVPIGRKEKADDVPARLSKNEFVFTADAVKAAGGGDIDQGAQRMYNVMKNLEAGGEISEQSQGQG
jgi:hypothetical protein